MNIPASIVPARAGTAENTEPLALYVHWPFCVSKCPYCDFNSHVREAVDQAEWREALLADLAHEAAAEPGRPLGSIFFGGGTPSLRGSTAFLSGCSRSMIRRFDSSAAPTMRAKGWTRWKLRSAYSTGSVST
jgi:coproporphyrinogen III oxidase-like Fe-S oxidoreductase